MNSFVMCDSKSIHKKSKARGWANASGHQPGGLTDSSRWLKRSENHRGKSEKSCTTKWCENLEENLLRASHLAPRRGATSSCLNRWSSLHYDHGLLSRPPSGLQDTGCGILHRLS